MRVYLLFYSERIHTLWKEGMFFRAMTHMEPIQALVKCFQIGTPATTVLSKTAHLAKVAIYAGRYFGQRGDAELKGRADTVAEYLTAVSAAYKRESRMMYQSRNTVQSRVERGMYLSPKDFDTSLSLAVSVLDDILSHLRQAGVIGVSQQDFEMQPTRAKKGKLDQRALHSIIDKWCLNFLVALIFGGGGQRPQGYAQLQQPDQLNALASGYSMHRNYFLWKQTGRRRLALLN